MRNVLNFLASPEGFVVFMVVVWGNVALFVYIIAETMDS